MDATLIREERDVSTQPPTRLASEDVIINAPMSYAGSAQRIMRIRRGAHGDGAALALTGLAILLVLVVWVLVTAWYLVWGYGSCPTGSFVAGHASARLKR